MSFASTHYICGNIISFSRADVITLQNPHGMPSASVQKAVSTAATPSTSAVTIAKPTIEAIVKTKAALPCEW